MAKQNNVDVPKTINESGIYYEEVPLLKGIHVFKADEIIIKKNQFANNVDYKMYFVTQFFFEANAFKSWEQHINTLGNKLEIHAGIPGPATLKILFS